MYFERITPDSFLFDAVKLIYETSFPSDEKRELDLLLFDKKDYSLMAAVEDRVIGFISFWDFGTFIFIEHLAVEKELRNQGIGSKMLGEFMNKYQNIILEVEKPQNEQQYLRIKFYEQFGFKLNHYPYVQPSYGKGKSPVPLYLLTYPRPLNLDQFTNIKKKLYEIVYDNSK
ncbi:MAG: GNAT family N-acetyltransferase [Candidatus Micrarchaeota archaeon]